MLFGIIFFVLGIVLGLLISIIFDVRRKPAGVIIVDPVGKEFELEVETEEDLDKILYKKKQVVLDVERTADFTDPIMKQ